MARYTEEQLNQMCRPASDTEETKMQNRKISEYMNKKGNKKKCFSFIHENYIAPTIAALIAGIIFGIVLFKISDLKKI
jgi:hypothetical protein